MFKKSIVTLLIFTFSIIILNSCSIPKAFKPSKVDSRERPTNAKERARVNVEEGRGISLKGMVSGRKGSGTFEFSTSNPMWRASLATLDFIPLSNVDYSGGIIITDWYSDSLKDNDSIKISLQFLSNEIRTDSLKIIVYNRKCNTKNVCQVSTPRSKIKQELLATILTKAKELEKIDKTKK
ncbi:DUF3576 domain-containing protein [Pelagibacteraceae bacterium]|nr:DUF3576 domain-containing protein [Pelagibacteraceae bacterium]